jgi:Protein of unknown function (DUF4239)
MLWLYDMPTWLLFLVVVGAFVLFGIGGLFATRKLVRALVGGRVTKAEGVDVFVGAVGVFYGLIAGLIAVAVWEQYATIDDRVAEEASSIGALYRQAEEFPPPARGELMTSIKALTYDTMTSGWERQRRGEIAIKVNPYLDRITSVLYRFQPANVDEAAIQQATMSEFEKLYELRRRRLHDASAGLPASLYAVVLIGGVLTIGLTYLLALERMRLHVVMTGIASAMIGLVVFMIVVMDHPFRGEVSIGPEDFEQAYSVLMR